MQDLKFAFRQLAKSPGFTAAVILIPAVGIGAVTVMFSALWGVVLRPLPFGQPERLVWADATTDTGQRNSVSALDYFDYQAQCPAFESLAARSVWQPGRVVTGKAEPERVASIKVSGNFFHTLGCAPLHGRSFTANEGVAGGPSAVIVSHAYWQRRLGGEPGIVGQEITIDGTVCTIVGVLPEGFNYPSGVDLWFPLQRGGNEESGRGNNNFFMIGRLADGVDLRQAQAQMAVVATRISAANPQEKGGWGAALVPLHEQFFGHVRPLMVLLMGATTLLLLIACANLSSLLVARVMSRRSELAIRLSLGASSWQVARQLLTESLVIAVAGAALGIGLAVVGIRAVKALGPAGLPRLQEIGIGAPVLGVAIAATALTALLSGVVTAWRGARVDLLSHLRGGGRATESRPHLTLRRTLVAVQVALSLVLLIVTGLLLRSAWQLQQVAPGFRAEGLLTMDVQIPSAGEANPQLPQRFAEMLERIRALPGVVDAAGADQLPLFGGPWNGVYRADRPPQTSSDLLPATRRMVTERFFETMGMPLLKGRSFAPADGPEAPLVTVVSQTLAQRLFPGENPVGKILKLPWNDDGIPLEIIGVAGDARDFGLAADHRPAFYVSLRQRLVGSASLRLVIRSSGQPAALAPSVRTAIRETEKDAALFRVGTMAEWLAGTMATRRFSASLLSAFAVVATALAAAGLFGLMSYSVTQRTHEIGIRMALGAQVGSVLYLVVRQGLVLTLTGIAAGIGGGLAVTRLIAGQLYGVGSTDALTFLLASLVLAGAAFFASLLPALRATRIHPMEALRTE
jgi:putative ABC transport system permease protein